MGGGTAVARLPPAREPGRSLPWLRIEWRRRAVALETGRRVGPYEVISLLGSGGMGEVYHARDTRLNRDIALKILPAALSIDPDRVARFDREAQLLAALNHPGIAAIYGVELSEGAPVLVLELVEGVTLADRLAAGPLALAFGIQETILAAGVLYVLICLATLGSRSVRDLQRAEATSEIR